MGQSEWSRIVGVVSDVKSLHPQPESVPEVYVPYRQWPMQAPTLVLRATGDTATLAGAIGRETKSAIPNLPPPKLQSRDELISETVAQPRLQTGLLGLFGMLAMALAAVGLYGVVALSVGQRSRVILNGDQKMLELLCAHGAARPAHLLGGYNDLPTAAAVFSANPALADDADALVNAANGGHEAFVRLMLRYRPYLPRRVSFPGWAVGAKTRELNELLFQHGLNPSAPDWLGITPLHEFARHRDVEKAAIFLDHGADIHARDEDICSTPLGWAAKFGRKAMVEFLLQRGAKPNLPDDPPWARPLAWATRRGHSEIAELLRRCGTE